MDVKDFQRGSLGGSDCVLDDEEELNDDYKYRLVSTGPNQTPYVDNKDLDNNELANDMG
jgi:hypothetical protein